MSNPANVTCFFEGNRIPELLYACKQDWTADHMPRPIHGHNGISELLVVYQGAGRYIAGADTYEVEAGDLLFYNSGDLHEIAPADATLIGAYGFGIANLHLRGLPEGHLLPVGASSVRRGADQAGAIDALCRLIYTQLAQERPFNEELCNHLLASLIIMALQLPDQPHRMFQRADYALVNEIRAYIDAHYNDYITLGSIADALGISPYYTSHIFKEVTGYSPIQYVIRRRIGEAQSLLIGTNYSATQIATMVGYDNTNYFNTIFTKMVGISPIRYRKQFLETMHGKHIH